jgi:hypothetical protein
VSGREETKLLRHASTKQPLTIKEEMATKSNKTIESNNKAIELETRIQRHKMQDNNKIESDRARDNHKL